MCSRVSRLQNNKQLEGVTEGHLTYRRLGLNLHSQHDVYIADDPDGTKRAVYEALRHADTDWHRLYQRGRKRANRDVAKLPRTLRAAVKNENVRERAEEVAAGVTEGLPPAASGPEEVAGEEKPSVVDNTPAAGDRAQSVGETEMTDEERRRQFHISRSDDTASAVRFGVSKGVADIWDQIQAGRTSMLSGATIWSARRQTPQWPRMAPRLPI
jgi:hypothetical protein